MDANMLVLSRLKCMYEKALRSEIWQRHHQVSIVAHSPWHSLSLPQTLRSGKPIAHAFMQLQHTVESLPKIHLRRAEQNTCLYYV
eukprot:scaffold126492_cov31-Prasinocladus_malaysianus.AAC.1